MLRANGVELAYGSVPILRGISLCIGASEMVAILGGNASGKTSLLNTLCGLQRPNQGQVFFENEEITALSAHQCARLGLTFCSAEKPLFADMSVQENLEMGAFRFGGIGAEHWDSTLKLAIELFPFIGEKLNQRAGTLSGGEQKALALSRALMSRPKMLLLDEPCLGLSAAGISTVAQALNALNANGLSILFSEQNITMAVGVAHRAYVLERGILEPLD